MNTSKVRSEIEKVIAENRSQMHPKMRNRQYKPGVAQLAKLTELGILDLMPKGFGFSDADAVLRAASDNKSAVMNAYGEGEDIPASALNQAVNEVMKTEDENIEETYQPRHSIMMREGERQEVHDRLTRQSSLNLRKQDQEWKFVGGINGMPEQFIEEVIRTEEWHGIHVQLSSWLIDYIKAHPKDTRAIHALALYCNKNQAIWVLDRGRGPGNMSYDKAREVLHGLVALVIKGFIDQREFEYCMDKLYPPVQGDL